MTKSNISHQVMRNLKFIKGSILSEEENYVKQYGRFDYVFIFRKSILLGQHKATVQLHVVSDLGPEKAHSRSYYLFIRKNIIRHQLERDFLEKVAGQLKVNLSHIEAGYFINLIELLVKNVIPQRSKFSILFLRNLVEQVVLMLMIKMKYKEPIQYVNSVDKDKELTYNFVELVKLSMKSQKKVSFYSSSLGVTNKILTQSVKAVFQCSPKDIIKQQLMQAATEHLMLTDLSIKEISYLLGFEEDNNFSAFFKKNKGVTPSAFREQVLHDTIVHELGQEKIERNTVA